MLRSGVLHKLLGHKVGSDLLCFAFCYYMCQVMQHDWVVTRGGAAPKLLDDGVARGAANVAALRRLRNLAHGAGGVEGDGKVAEQMPAARRADSQTSITFRPTAEK